MTPEQIIALILGVLGAGGVGGTIVNVLANRKKEQANAELIRAEAKKLVAEATLSLSDAYETRIKNLTDRTIYLEHRLDETTVSLRQLFCTLTDREAVISALQNENTELKAEVDKLRKEVKRRDARILELERRVAELSKRFDSMDDEGSL